MGFNSTFEGLKGNVISLRRNQFTNLGTKISVSLKFITLPLTADSKVGVFWSVTDVKLQTLRIRILPPSSEPRVTDCVFF